MLHCGTKLLTKSRLHTKKDKKHGKICHVSGKIAIFTAAVETSHIKPLFKNEKTNHHSACRHRDSGGGGRTGQARRIVRDAARRHRNARSGHGRRIPPHLSHRRLPTPHHRRRRIHAICPLRRQRRTTTGVRRARHGPCAPPFSSPTPKHNPTHTPPSPPPPAPTVSGNMPSPTTPPDDSGRLGGALGPMRASVLQPNTKS